MSNKRGQAGEAITWMVATIIIIVILLLGVFVAGGSSAAKGLLGLDKDVEYKFISDRILEKSLYSFLLYDNGGFNYDQLKSDENLNSINGHLADSIFHTFYDSFYKEVWFGVSTYGRSLAIIGFGWDGNKNPYFGGKPIYRSVGPVDTKLQKDSISQTAWLKDNYYIQILLVGEKKP